jgi:thioredoxin reductase
VTKDLSSTTTARTGSRRKNRHHVATKIWDVLIAGAGPAGLSAALVLGRARRKVLLCDTGTPRSWAAREMHSFLTRDGIPPAEFRQLAHTELAHYPSVVFRAAEVTTASRAADGYFIVTIGKRRTVRARKLLIATGVFDHLPKLAGIEEFFGTSVFQCPYCDGWETRDAPIAVYGKRRRGFEMARAMTAWSDNIVLCTDGAAMLSVTEGTCLQRNGIAVMEQRIERLEGTRGKLRQIVFRDGTRLERSALFFDTPCSGQSKLAQALGCQFSRHGGIKCGQYEATSVPGVFAAGNIIKDVQLVIVAAAEGTRAAFGINRALTREDFDRRATGSRRIQHPSLEDPAMHRRRRKHA